MKMIKTGHILVLVYLSFQYFILSAVLTCTLCSLGAALFLLIIQRCIQGWYNDYYLPFMLVRM